MAFRFSGEEIARDVEDWVRCESPTHEAAAVNRMLDLVIEAYRGCDVRVERIPGQGGFGDVLKVSGGRPTSAAPILLLSHVDTVHPLGTAAADLTVRRDGDRLYGPGSYDMKGGVALATWAFRDVVRNSSASRPVVYLYTPDEEVGSLTSRALIEQEARTVCAALVTEPARDGGRIVTARKGVGRFLVEVEGRPAHAGSRHQDGRSAIREAARQILVVEAMTDYARGVTTTVGMMQGGTAMNVIPHKAWFRVDLRVTTVEDGIMEEARILGLQPHDPDVALRITGGMNRPPMEKTAEVAALLAIAQETAAQIGFALDDVPMVGGGSDGNFTAALGVPTLDGLGVDGDGAHTLHEHCLVSSLAPRAELMSRLLERL
jgi:glutamate carboxypeptidase